MFDDDAGFVGERFYAFPCRICISDIVVRQFFTLQLRVAGQCAGCRCQIAVERCGLVRIFTVTHVLHFIEMQIQCLRISAAGCVLFVFTEAGQVIGDCAIVLCGVRKHFFRQCEIGFVADLVAIGFHFSQYAAVIGRIDNHSHIFVIFSGRTQHGRAADVDVFNRIFQRAFCFRHGLLERIQIHHHHVDGRDLVLFQCCHVFRQITTRQNAAMYFRVQGFDAAIQHLREACVIRDFCHWQAVVSQQFCRTAGREQFDTECRQFTCKFQNTGFIGDGDKSLFDHVDYERLRKSVSDCISVITNRAAAVFCAGCYG